MRIEMLEKNTVMACVGMIRWRFPTAPGLRRAATIAGCMACALLGSPAATLAHHLGPEAYNVLAQPKPGPVERFQPFKSLPAIPFKLPFDWGVDPYGDHVWQNRLHMLRALVDKALVAGDFNWPSEVFRDWQEWHRNGRTAPRSWGDAITGTRAARLAYLLHSTDWQDRKLVALAEEHAAWLSNPKLLTLSNHSIQLLHGLAALCLDGKLRSCAGADAYLEPALDALLESQFTRLGMHRENSPDYHFYAARNLLRMAPILRAYAPQIDAVLDLAMKQGKWLVRPDLTTVPLGDSYPTLRAAAALDLPAGDPSCKTVQSYDEAPDCYLLRHYPGVGYVIARSDWAIPAPQSSMIFVQGGFFRKSHRDADDFSVDWFDQGRQILSDSGKYGDTRDDWDAYFSSTRAHNTVEVDGLNYSVKNDHVYGNAVRSLEKSATGIKIVLQIDRLDMEVSHKREIDFQPGQQLIIKDVMESQRPHNYIQWHHFAREFELSGGGERFELDDGEVVVELETSSNCGADTRYHKAKGQTEPRAQGWASVEERQRHPRWALGVECQARNATFEARFRLAPR